MSGWRGKRNLVADNRDQKLIDQALEGIKQAKEAGNGEIVVKVADHFVVAVKIDAQYGLRTEKKV